MIFDFHARSSVACRWCSAHRRPPMLMLDYERLDVYQRAIEFLALAADVVDSLPRGRGTLRKQLEDASFSITQNIAEGVGKPTDAERMRYYGIARGSAMECGAIFDACRVLKLIDPARWETGKSLLVRIVSMLTKMCR
jgi:four helix bundle protein